MEKKKSLYMQAAESMSILISRTELTKYLNKKNP